VLVVDDDARVREVFRAAVEGVAEVVEAADGGQALGVLERAAGRGLDLLLVDQVMPDRSGLEILQVVKARWPQLPVVLITGYGSEELAIRALRAGAADYLKKPVDVSEFRRVVASHGRNARPALVRSLRPPNEAEAMHEGIRRALAFIREHFSEHLTLSQVAGEARLSKFHFCRLFQQQAGYPFRRYLQEVRIDRAKALLGSGQLTVTEVAYETGFNDLSHFDRVFSRIVGVSPTGYRRAVRAA
jgi:YesN/AraC family two-component response regulator